MSSRTLSPASPLIASLLACCVAAGSGCVTPATAMTAATPPSGPATPTGPAAAGAPPAPEVLVLRDRVARLEKRLADVDARLGLLLARDGGAPAQAPLRFDAPRGEQRAVDLGPAPPRDGTASIDIERPTPVIDEGPPIVDDGLVAPGDDDGGPDDGDAPRLVLRGAPAGRDNDGADDGAGDPLAAMQSAKDLYEWAQARRREGRLIEAIAGFEDVVGRFPRDDLADNAVYWTGLCHQLRNDHKLAISVWQKLPLRFPRSAKIPDALYGMGQSHEALGEPALAEALYDEVISSYPKAEKRSDARKALLRLRPLR